MFINKSKLEHLLLPTAYFDEERYQKELENIFRPSWQLVATLEDLAQHGDFLTLELFGTPLQIRNIDGEIHAYVNICSHRHCLLTSRPKGNDPHFRCQYHGWEYAKSGSTRKIPDARCFRPFDRENARLCKIRCETAGSLVFVTLREEAPTLEEFLGSFHSDIIEIFGADFQQILKWDTTYEANWKVVVENSLESYHVPFLHKKTFRELPPEEVSEHVLQENYTTYRQKETLSKAKAVQNWFVKRLKRSPTNIYRHTHIHPNFIYTSNDLHRTAHLILPTSNRTSRHIVWVFGLKGANPLAYLSRVGVKLIARQVLLEDAPIFKDVQKGLEASPFRGVIGTREERLYAFQDYVMRAILPSEK